MGTLPIIATLSIPTAYLCHLQHEGSAALTGCREQIARLLPETGVTQPGSSKCASLSLLGFDCDQQPFDASSPFRGGICGLHGS